MQRDAEFLRERTEVLGRGTRYRFGNELIALGRTEVVEELGQLDVRGPVARGS